MYGLSPVFTVAADITDGSSLVPDALGDGDHFRVLFLSSTARGLSASSISTYNTWIQDRADAGHPDLGDFSSGFRAVGSTAAIDARDNTATTSAFTDVPIYWATGSKVADDYEDFYDGDWDDEANPKDESGGDAGSTAVAANWPGTGSDHDGTEDFDSDSNSLALGSSGDVTLGRLNASGSGNGPLSSGSSPQQGCPAADLRPFPRPHRRGRAAGARVRLRRVLPARSLPCSLTRIWTIPPPRSVPTPSRPAVSPCR